MAEDGSAFGAGWTFGPMDRLVSISQQQGTPSGTITYKAGKLRVYGTTGLGFYEEDGSGVNIQIKLTHNASTAPNCFPLACAGQAPASQQKSLTDPRSSDSFWPTCGSMGAIAQWLQGDQSEISLLMADPITFPPGSNCSSQNGSR